MKKQLKRVLAIAGLVFMCVCNHAYSQTTIGLTQELYESTNSVGDKVYTGMENVSITMDYGSNITNVVGDSKDRLICLNTDEGQSTYNANSSCWKKRENGIYDGQNVGYKLTVAQGYSLSLSEINARIIVGDDTYTWYAQITDAYGSELYKSEEKTASKTITESLSEGINLTDLTGDVYVYVWVKQGGTTKYFVVDNLTVKATTAIDERKTYKVSTSVGIGEGVVTPETGYFVEGSDVIVTATPSIGFMFQQFIVEDYSSEFVGTTTENPYIISDLKSNVTITATFLALPSIRFSTGNDPDIVGTVPQKEYVYPGDYYTLPQAFFLKKDGYTLTGWRYNSDIYPIGSKIPIYKDMIFDAVFTPNEVSLGDEPTVVNWTFSPKDGAPVINCENSTMYYVQKAEIKGKTIDVSMFVDTRDGAGIEGKRGKLNNASQTDRAQVNAGTVFEIPAVKGMTVTYTCTNGTPDVSSLSFNDEQATEVNGGTIMYEYTGNDPILRIVDNTGNFYPSGLTAVYPTKSFTLKVEDTGFYSLYLDYNAEIPYGITAYTGVVNSDETSLVLTPVEGSILPKNTAVLVKGVYEQDYIFNSTEKEDGVVSENSLKGVNVETNAADLIEEGKTVLTLGMLNGEIGFRKPAGGVIEANKAYLLVNESAGGPGKIIRLVIDGEQGDGETTGIESVSEHIYDNAPCYNITGQRVSESAKGIVIKNGKKIIKK